MANISTDVFMEIQGGICMKEGKKSMLNNLKKHIDTKKIETVAYVKEHRWEMFRTAVFAMVLVVSHTTGFCTLGKDIDTGMPWDTAVNKIQSSMVGGLAKTGATVGTVASVWMWYNGADLSKTALKITMAATTLLAAPTALEKLSGAASGCLF
jgi:hypothetical protein